MHSVQAEDGGKLTLWLLIALTLSHGAVAGHQGAQSWAHLFRSHNKSTSPGLGSWVLSVRIWRHARTTLQDTSLSITIQTISRWQLFAPDVNDAPDADTDVTIKGAVPHPRTHHGHCWPALPVDPRPCGAGWAAEVSLWRCCLMGEGLEGVAHGTLCYPNHDLDPDPDLCLSFACE